MFLCMKIKITITSVFHQISMRVILSAVVRFILPVIFITACNPSFQTQKAAVSGYRITTENAKDSSVLFLLKPYSDSINSTMNGVIGYTEKDLEKKQPEGSLGNFMADAFFTMAKEKFNEAVDGAWTNYGSIRMTQLLAGSITRGEIYELMPFDNVLILQKMKGEILQQVLDLIAGRGGWPLAGITMQIKNKKAVNVMIGEKPIDAGKVYTIAHSDFIANGGDNADMLKSIPQQNIGYLMRDALIDYITKQKKEGKNITATEENRVTNAQ
jgi:2',3'-cyclic-nucleotide 2'-phosphodiesterase (5'-nucleotidase family)